VVSSVPLATLADQYVIDGCRNALPAGGIPCIAVRFVTAATRIRVGGVPVLLQESQAVCEPTGVPALIAPIPTRVTGV
jgi:hypothetical protein